MSCNVSFAIAGIGCDLLLVVNPICGLSRQKENRKLMSSCRRKDKGTSGIPQMDLIKERQSLELVLGLDRRAIPLTAYVHTDRQL